MFGIVFKIIMQLSCFSDLKHLGPKTKHGDLNVIGNGQSLKDSGANKPPLSLGHDSDHVSEDDSFDYDDPIFYKQPSDAFVIKSRPATLHCRVSQALDIHFKVCILFQT